MRKLPSFFALRAFESAARQGSFALAAKELHLTPSAISHQVHGLEAYFGKPLFDRLTRRVELTPDGTQLLSGLSRAFDLIESSCADISLPEETESLAVHCTPSFASKWLGPHLPQFMQAFPRITIHMSSSADPIDLIQHEEIDIAIAYGSAKARSGVTIEALGTEVIAPLCSPKLLTGSAEIDINAMTGFTLIDSQLSPVTWQNWFDLHGLTLPDRPRLSFDRGSLAISAALNGLGVSLESTRLARQEIASGELVQLGTTTFRPLIREMHFVCYRAARANSRKIKSFRDWLFIQTDIV
ncbi:LysR substrate-binding domain-containing protein [Glaciimonas immobilis]|uniref:DNA-binding transcriptional LysR family regulator n=1 Tax=Glaciimonas immobilis TaxID=728004 RepID=A0A840RTC4_9BURK|nr:LysR substrate-binding domain-containing protein [Glaciimonas immobilis]KAF3999816.1 LysR family transcriptional regulator [Glaciimonas immobilis]MBB5200288.1 DNA-binding transcriptional LysR family regulator [Glaciimonas immobilis]